MSTNNPKVDAMLAQYASNTKPKTTTKEGAVAYDPRNYFSTFPKKDVDSASFTVRILPTNDDSTPFEEVTVHKVKVQGKFQTFICPDAMDGKPCPFCEARKALYAEYNETQDESLKEAAKEYGTRLMYAPRIIDRSDADFGPIVWRFNHDYSHQGVFDKIMALVKIVGDISDKNTGRDITVIVGRDQNKNPVVQSVVQGDPTPLHSNPEVAEAWLANTKTWRSVYGIKPYDYLAIIVKGGVPEWSKKDKCWVDKLGLVQATPTKTEEEGEVSSGKTKPTTEATTTSTTTETVQALPTAEPEQTYNDDLPF